MKIKLSKSQWEEAGKKAGWIKAADATLIDNKYYDDKTGEEVSNPNEAKDTTVMVNGVPYLFELGKTYKDHAGQYIIEEIKDGGKLLKVKYIDGSFQDQTREYSAIDRAKIIHRENVRQDQENRIQTMGFSGNKEYFGLGYLAKNGTVSAQVPPSERKWFEESYKKLTGDDAVRHLHTAAYEIPKEESRWHLELRIGFPEADDALLSQMSFKDLNITRIKSGGFKINSNHFVFNLFKMGFKLGKQNVNDIIGHIPDKYMGDFNAGASVE